MNKKIDLILWNPPYVPTPTEEVIIPTNKILLNKNIEAAWAGGIKGREVIDRFIKRIPVL